MTDFQRIFVVSTRATTQEAERLRSRLAGRTAVVTAPTGEAKRVVLALGRDAVPEVALAPVAYPGVDRGHRLDELVRRHATEDRFRDVVVIADPATITLLLRVLAPDQLPEAGSVTEVGLPRGPRPVQPLHAVIGGVGIAVVAGLFSGVVPVWVLPVLALLAGLVLMVVPSRRHVGEMLLIASGISVLVSLLVIAGSTRFPGSW